ncbi:MAG: hypothetical protein ACRCU2_28795 [Planktothrix sp.]
MSEYSEPEKNKARSAVISSAIEALTRNRSVSTLARRSYVRDVRDHILSKDNPYDARVAKKLSDKTIERWESFYDSIVQSRSPENLKVAYLSGPNPENDLRVFCNAGVLPENIWAFESNNKIYRKALKSALKSEFPFIKIINGGLDKFIEASPQRFDIIYLDFCGPLPSTDQQTLLALTRILAKHALNSPGVLITNFSLPTIDQNEAGRSLLSKLVSCYLYPKAFVEDEDSESGFSPGAVAQGLDTDEWFKKVSNDLDYYYGQFVTRLLIDHASLISPYNRFPKNNFLYTKFFNADKRSLLNTRQNSYFHFDEEDKGGGGDVIVDSEQHPILWTLAALDKELNRGDCNYPQFIFEDEKFAEFAELFLRELDVNTTKEKLIDSFFTISFLLAEGNGQEEFWSKELKALKALYEKHSFRDFYQFCDLLLFHQIFEALFRQVAVPYHVNISETKRWSYKAKDTPMYMDMMILDECRYLYDWMPTTDMFLSEISDDMFLSGISDIERQLSYRFALDGVAKHIRWYNPEYFFGTAVVDQFTKGFEAKTLKPRETIKN